MDAATTVGRGPWRWEWRTFDFDAAIWNARRRRLEITEATRRTSEVYVVAPGCSVNVKVRDGRLEAKQLVRTSEDGLELWRPVLNIGFPLDPIAFTELVRLWDRPIPVVPVDTVEDLFAHLAQYAPDIRILPVTKWRTRFRMHDCDGEEVTLLVRGALYQGLAFEHADIATVRAAVGAIDQQSKANTSYLAFLRNVADRRVARIPNVLAGGTP